VHASHALCEGKDTKRSGSYPTKMARILHEAFFLEYEVMCEFEAERRSADCARHSGESMPCVDTSVGDEVSTFACCCVCLPPSSLSSPVFDLSDSSPLLSSPCEALRASPPQPDIRTISSGIAMSQFPRGQFELLADLFDANEEDTASGGAATPAEAADAYNRVLEAIDERLGDPGLSRFSDEMHQRRFPSLMSSGSEQIAPDMPAIHMQGTTSAGGPSGQALLPPPDPRVASSRLGERPPP